MELRHVLSGKTCLIFYVHNLGTRARPIFPCLQRGHTHTQLACSGRGRWAGQSLAVSTAEPRHSERWNPFSFTPWQAAGGAGVGDGRENQQPVMGQRKCRAAWPS